ncbi:MAG: 2-C-methyl-D-erythritol 2,4-cyclodiphosphate synthase [Planctomycetota bacterium]|nr:2-C-methyl-D-erythritol 2,4-cyclodiphosphate synthase [Planctomycetota bacterium]
MDDYIERLRIGFGTDLHELVENGRPLLFAGVEVPYPNGLGPRSHSDGDAVLHALIDAILGAAGRDDIGTHFPNDDPAYADISSKELLERTLESCSLRIINVDMTINCDRPKLSGAKQEIRGAIARELHLPRERAGRQGEEHGGP